MSGDGNSVSVADYTGTSTDVEVPDSASGGGPSLPVVGVDRLALANKGLTSVTFPSTLTTIGANALVTNRLTSVTVPAGVTSIGDKAFTDNLGLTSVTLLGPPPAGVASDGSGGGSFGAPSDALTLFVPAKFLATTYTGGYTTPLWKGYTTRAIFPTVTVGGITYSINSDREATVTGYTGTATSVTIPETITAFGTTCTIKAIAPDALAGRGITTVRMLGPKPTLGTNGFGSTDTVAVRFPIRYEDKVVAGGYSGQGWDGYPTRAFVTATFVASGTSSTAYVDIGTTLTDPGDPEVAGKVFTGWFDESSLTTPHDFGPPPEADLTIHAGLEDEVAADISGPATVTTDLVAPVRWEPTGLAGHPDPSVSVTAGTLPDGLTINGTTGVITGSVKDLDEVGDHTITLTASTGRGTPATTQVTFRVNPQVTINRVRYLLDGTTASAVGYSTNVPPRLGMLATFDLDGTSFTVTGIGDGAFRGAGLTDAAVSSTVTSIGADAFADNPGLVLVHLAGSAPTLGPGAFGASDPLIRYQWMFGSSQLDGGYTPGTWMGYRTLAVASTSFALNGGTGTTPSTQKIDVDGTSKVTKPSSVPTRTGRQFTGWYTDAAATTLYDFAKPATGDLTLFAGYNRRIVDGFIVTTAGTSATIIGYDGVPPRDLTVPAQLVDDGQAFDVVGLGTNALSMKGIRTVSLPDGLVTIGDLALHSNELTSVTIPDSVTRIGSNAFIFNQLASVDLGDGLTTIGQTAFALNQLIGVALPDSLTVLGKGAFYKNSLTSVTFGAGLTSIAETAFYGNLLTSVTIPETVTAIGIEAFRDNKLTTIVVGSKVITVGNRAFQDNPGVKVRMLGARPTVTPPSQVELDDPDAPDLDFGVFDHTATVRVPLRFMAAKIAGGYPTPTWEGAAVVPFVEVSFDGHDADTPAPPTQLVDVDEPASAPQAPTRDGYFFRGWFTSAAATGKPFDFSAPLTSDVALHAGWGVAPVIAGPATVALELGQKVLWTPTTLTGTPAPNVAVTAGELPDGLTLNAATGVVSGSVTDPAEIGTHTVSLTADNGRALVTIITFTVARGPVASLTITASDARPVQGGTVTFSALGRNASGQFLGDVSTTTTFTSSVASDVVRGNVIAVAAAGPRTITARNGTATQSIVLDVGPVAAGVTATIADSPREGRTLTAVTGGIDPRVTVTYQWLADGRTIPGATGPTLRLRKAQAGRLMSVRVTATASGAATTVTSEQTRAVSSARKRLVLSTGRVEKEQRFTVTATGLRPGQSMAIWLGGVKAYTGRADDTGTVRRSVQLPASIQPGKRRVRVSGYSKTGKRTFTVARTVRYLSR